MLTFLKECTTVVFNSDIIKVGQAIKITYRDGSTSNFLINYTQCNTFKAMHYSGNEQIFSISDFYTDDSAISCCTLEILG